jgi:hypothetical protein
MATPHVSGAAAIAKQANPTWTVTILKAALMATANKANGGDHLDNTYGAGLIDVMQLITEPYVNGTIHRGEPFAAYGRWKSAENNYTVQNITNSTYFTLNITVPAGATSIKSVLYWEEVSTEPRSQMSLYLIDPAGNTADNSTIANSTVQMTYNAIPTAGQWTLNVTGDSVHGTETFVLFTSIRTNQTTYAYAEVNMTGALQNFTAVPDNDRVNYTDITNISWPLGQHAIKFYSNDSLNNWGASDTAYVTVKGWAGINESSAPAAINQSTVFEYFCRAADSNTTAPLNNFSVLFWVNESSSIEAATNSSGWAGINMSIESGGVFALKCNVTGNPALFYDSDGGVNTSIITVNDTEAPRYENLTTSPTSYTGADWQSNATWTDNTMMGTVLFESNYTGNFSNYSTSVSDQQYYFTIGGGNLTNGKTVAYRWIANDSTGNRNSTPEQTFTVTNRPSPPPSGGGGSGAVAAAPSAKTINLNSKFAVAETYQSSLLKGDRAIYEFAGENHTLKVASVTDTSVTLTIASMPYNVTLSIGEIGKIDLNNDGTDDLAITLDRIRGSMADMTFAKISPPPAEAPGQNATQTEVNKTQEQPEQPEAKQELGGILLAVGAFLGVFGLAATGAAIIKLGGRPKRRR